ncbi:MAG: SRPBCC domain-containing protein, partial [Colwellia sp.]|nr:SRPBCC domain-containing protein [Colwellia sp.]
TTLVAITLTAIDDNKTKLQLNHSEFTEEGFRDHHKEGWHGCLANLKKVEQKTADING